MRRILNDYNSFNGRHHETGMLHNYFAATKVKAPHSGHPYSEALLLGLSGGIAVGYFTFAYQGYDPHVALLTRNTFNPLATMLTRLAVDREYLKTTTPKKAVKNLVDTLEDGVPAIVWADMWSLPYSGLPYDAKMWGSIPILVYGYDDQSNEVFIADRAAVPLRVTTDQLMAARGRIKKDKYQTLRLDIPNSAKLRSAVTGGIKDCIKLFLEKPPRGTARNFGLAAYRNWIELLVNPKKRQSWDKEFPPGPKMFAAQTSTFNHMGSVGIRGDADRSLYADFLEEASVILDSPDLKSPAELFRQSATGWKQLGETLLPDDVPAFKRTRELMIRRSKVFIEKGAEALEEMRSIDDQLKILRKEIGQAYPLDDASVLDWREQVACVLQNLLVLEEEAVRQMQAATNS